MGLILKSAMKKAISQNFGGSHGAVAFGREDSLPFPSSPQEIES